MAVILIPISTDDGPCDYDCKRNLIAIFGSITGVLLVACVYFSCKCFIIPTIKHKKKERNDLTDPDIQRNVETFMSSSDENMNSTGSDIDIESYRKFNTYVNQNDLHGCSYDTFCKIKKNLLDTSHAV